MSEVPSDLPEAATRRFAEGAFTSGLTVPDFAACLQMGLEPVGYVQGYCVMQWQWYGMGSPYGSFGTPYRGQQGGYAETWQCPHGFVSAEHRGWGQNYEQSWIEDAWSEGFTSAYHRMVEEAAAVGAHGIVGLVDSSERLSDMGVLEFRVQGTAVRVKDGPPPADGRPWTTYLAGQRLAKLIEAGYAPVTIAAAVASVRVWAYCITEYLTEGGSQMWGPQNAGAEIEQMAKAQMAVRRLAREHVRGQLDGDALHGASMSTTERELGQGDAELQCILRGNRVRRFKPFDPMPVPQPTVRLS
jgi:Putative heavy-metal-binding